MYRSALLHKMLQKAQEQNIIILFIYSPNFGLVSFVTFYEAIKIITLYQIRLLCAINYYKTQTHNHNQYVTVY